MMFKHPVRRRIARDLARVGAICSALMLGLTTWITIEGGTTPVYAAVTGGTATVTAAGTGSPLTSGASATHFVVKPPDASKCSGDTANNGYKVNTYMVPASVDPSALTFNNNGPVLPQGSGETFAQPLYSAGDLTPITNLPTGPGDGLVVGIPPMTLELFSTVTPTPDGFFPIAAGTYNVGVVCALTTAQPYTLDKFWNVQFTVTADAADSPGAFTWTVSDGGGTTTTTATTSPGSTITTTTGPGGSTTTTTTGGTTTTVAGGSTTTTTTRTGVLGETSSNPISGTPLVSELPRTGAPTATFVFWSVLLLVFGRMAILLGRTPKVIPATG